jgi:hypothetical protein
MPAGPAGLISRRFNRPSNNRTDDALADAAIKILRSTYADFGPTLATEKLRTQHGIDLAKRPCVSCRSLRACGSRASTGYPKSSNLIDGICANTPAAKGRVERAHLTLQDRLVMADYNSRFAKVPREVHDAHRPVREDEDLDLIFSWREQRRFTENLTLRYERKLYSLKETKDLRRYAGTYVDVYQFPDGRIEVRIRGASIPYPTFDKIGEIDQGAVVENKRLNHALRISSITPTIEHRP